MAGSWRVVGGWRQGWQFAWQVRHQRKVHQWQARQLQKVWPFKQIARRHEEKRQEALRPGMELRRQQEQDTTRGERIWFSRYVQNGKLKHWILITHGTKYELRRDRNATSGKSKYIYNIQRPYSLDNAHEQLMASLEEMKIPETDGYNICLIGWTKKSREEVDAACALALKEFGEYNLLFNNCQHFLRRLASAILQDKAADHDWFDKNTMTKYQKDTIRLQPAEVMIAMMVERAAAQMAQQQGQAHHGQNHMSHSQQQQLLQTQLQSQLQSQLQNQLQNQIQNTMLMQNQAFQPGFGG